jgi:hypothetical protein
VLAVRFVMWYFHSVLYVPNVPQDLVTVIETRHTATHFVFCSCGCNRLNLVSGGFATLTPNVKFTAKFPACLRVCSGCKLYIILIVMSMSDLWWLLYSTCWFRCKRRVQVLFRHDWFSFNLFKYCMYILIFCFFLYYFGFCLKGHYGKNGDNYISGSYNFNFFT